MTAHTQQMENEFKWNEDEVRLDKNNTLSRIVLLRTLHKHNKIGGHTVMPTVTFPSLFLNITVPRNLQLLFLCTSKPLCLWTFSSFYQGCVTTEMIKTFGKLIHFQNVMTTGGSGLTPVRL